jgi:hypothetical protein
MLTPFSVFFLNFKISHFYVYENYDVKNVDRYDDEKCMQKKIRLKNILNFDNKYKKQIPDKRNFKIQSIF